MLMSDKWTHEFKDKDAFLEDAQKSSLNLTESELVDQSSRYESQISLLESSLERINQEKLKAASLGIELLERNNHLEQIMNELRLKNTEYQKNIENLTKELFKAQKKRLFENYHDGFESGDDFDPDKQRPFSKYNSSTFYYNKTKNSTFMDGIEDENDSKVEQEGSSTQTLYKTEIENLQEELNDLSVIYKNKCFECDNLLKENKAMVKRIQCYSKTMEEAEAAKDKLEEQIQENFTLKEKIKEIEIFIKDKQKIEREKEKVSEITQESTQKDLIYQDQSPAFKVTEPTTVTREELLIQYATQEILQQTRDLCMIDKFNNHEEELERLKLKVNLIWDKIKDFCEIHNYQSAHHEDFINEEASDKQDEIFPSSKAITNIIVTLKNIDHTLETLFNINFNGKLHENNEPSGQLFGTYLNNQPHPQSEQTGHTDHSLLSANSERNFICYEEGSINRLSKKDDEGAAESEEKASFVYLDDYSSLKDELEGYKEEIHLLKQKNNKLKEKYNILLSDESNKRMEDMCHNEVLNFELRLVKHKLKSLHRKYLEETTLLKKNICELTLQMQTIQRQKMLLKDHITDMEWVKTIRKLGPSKATESNDKNNMP